MASDQVPDGPWTVNCCGRGFQSSQRHCTCFHGQALKGAEPRLGTPNAIQAAYMFGRKDLMVVLGAQESDLKGVPTPPSAASPGLIGEW